MKARSDKSEALLDAMNGVLGELTSLQLNSEFCRMLAYSKIPKGVIGRADIKANDETAWKRQRDKRDAYKKRRDEANCAMRKAP